MSYGVVSRWRSQFAILRACGSMDCMLPTPTQELVSQRVQEFDTDAQTATVDRVVDHVFSERPTNTSIDDVLTKVVVLNGLYSTQIYAVYAAAKHIVALDIDGRLESGDLELVEKIARMEFSDGKERCNLSFASKYCSWHQPDLFQILDSYVTDLLWGYQKQHSFGDFRYKKDLEIYPQFVNAVDQFCNHFGLAGVSRRNVDKFLWIEGRGLKVNK